MNDKRGKTSAPLAVMLLVVGLPVAAVVAGLATVVIATQQGFTPIATQVAPKGH